MTGLPDHVMLDNNTLNLLQENDGLLSAVTETDVELYVTIFQYNEFTNNLDGLPPEKRGLVRDQIDTVLKESDLKTTTVETSGYGEAYGHNYTGDSSDIYEELVQSHPNIGRVQRADAVGAEAAINRKMPFVTEDGALKKKMREYGYQKYVFPLDEFRELFEG